MGKNFGPTIRSAVAATIAAEWQVYREMQLGRDADAACSLEAQQAFYAGAMATMVMIVEMGDAADRSPNSRVPKEMIARYEQWYKDLLTFSFKEAEKGLKTAAVEIDRIGDDCHGK